MNTRVGVWAPIIGMAWGFAVGAFMINMEQEDQIKDLKTRIEVLEDADQTEVGGPLVIEAP